MSFKLSDFTASPSQELLDLAKKSDLLDIADHYRLLNVKKTISGAGNVCFLRRSCTSGYKHEISDYVLQTFLVNIFSLAIANFSIFKMANGNFKMATKFIC